MKGGNFKTKFPKNNLFIHLLYRICSKFPPHTSMHLWYLRLKDWRHFRNIARSQCNSYHHKIFWFHKYWINKDFHVSPKTEIEWSHVGRSWRPSNMTISTNSSIGKFNEVISDTLWKCAGAPSWWKHILIRAANGTFSCSSGSTSSKKTLIILVEVMV